MNQRNYLNEELNRLDRLIKINSANLKKHKDIKSENILISSSSNGIPQFKVRNADSATTREEIYTGRSYVRQSDLAPIKKLVQKQYEERLQKALLTNRSFKVSNNTGNTVNGWTLKVPTSQLNMSSSWNVNVTKQNGNYVITPVDWNRSIPSGSSVEFGCIGDGQIGNSLSLTIE